MLTQREAILAVAAGVFIAYGIQVHAQTTPPQTVPDRVNCYAWSGGHKSAGGFAQCDVPAPRVVVVEKQVPAPPPVQQSAPPPAPKKKIRE